MSLENNQKDIVMLTAGIVQNLLDNIFNAFPFYQSVKFGQFYSVLFPQRISNLGFHGKVIRAMVNVPNNTRLNETAIGFSKIIDFPVSNKILITIPAGVTGQLDSGILENPIPFNADEDVALFLVRSPPTAGRLITLERFNLLCEVTG